MPEIAVPKLLGYLHSSMVRLETLERAGIDKLYALFTFQYG